MTLSHVRCVVPHCRSAHVLRRLRTVPRKDSILFRYQFCRDKKKRLICTHGSFLRRRLSNPNDISFRLLVFSLLAALPCKYTLWVGTTCNLADVYGGSGVATPRRRPAATATLGNAIPIIVSVLSLSFARIRTTCSINRNRIKRVLFDVDTKLGPSGYIFSVTFYGNPLSHSLVAVFTCTTANTATVKPF